MRRGAAVRAPAGGRWRRWPRPPRRLRPRLPRRRARCGAGAAAFRAMRRGAPVFAAEALGRAGAAGGAAGRGGVGAAGGRAAVVPGGRAGGAAAPGWGGRGAGCDCCGGAGRGMRRRRVVAAAAPRPPCPPRFDCAERSSKGAGPGATAARAGACESREGDAKREAVRSRETLALPLAGRETSRFPTSVGWGREPVSRQRTREGGGMVDESGYGGTHPQFGAAEIGALAHLYRGRALPQHRVADAPRRHHQLGRGLDRPRPVAHLQQRVGLAAAAGAGGPAGRRVPAHRGAALPLLRLLARAGAHPGDPVLRADPARPRRADRQRLERGPAPGLPQATAAHHLLGRAGPPPAPELRLDLRHPGGVLPRQAAHPPRADRLARGALDAGGDRPGPGAARAAVRLGLPRRLGGGRGRHPEGPARQGAGQDALEEDRVLELARQAARDSDGNHLAVADRGQEGDDPGHLDAGREGLAGEVLRLESRLADDAAEAEFGRCLRAGSRCRRRRGLRGPLRAARRGAA